MKDNFMFSGRIVKMDVEKTLSWRPTGSRISFSNCQFNSWCVLLFVFGVLVKLGKQVPEKNRFEKASKWICKENTFKIL